MDFVKLAPYLRDPLVLIGFMLFLAFLFARKLLSSGIIPPVGAGRGARILRLILHYGFIIGLLITVLGFGLKYRELSEQEQRSALGLLRSELEYNTFVARELHANTITLTNAAQAVASVLRSERLRINHGLFPPENIDPSSEQNPDLYNQRFEWLQTSGLLKDATELRRFREQNAAVVRSADRMSSTLKSLGDRHATRYVIYRAAFDANLPVLRRITIANPEQLASLYAKTAEVREKYFRVAESVEEYLVAVRAYCSHDVPDRTALGAVLATERLTVRLLKDHRAELESLTGKINDESRRMETALDRS